MAGVTDEDLIFSTAFDTFKNDLSGTATVHVSGSVPAGTTGSFSTTVPHNLGYIPDYQLYYNDSDNVPAGWTLCPDSIFSGVDGNSYVIQGVMTTTELRITLFMPNTSGSSLPAGTFDASFKYFIFA